MNPFLVMAQQGKSAKQVAQDTMFRNMKINQKAAQLTANKTGKPAYWNQGPMKGHSTSMGGVQNPLPSNSGSSSLGIGTAGNGIGARNAPWKTAIDQRVTSGGQLGLNYLNTLSNQYGTSLSQLNNFIANNNYTMGAKAAAAVAPASAPAPSGGQMANMQTGLEEIKLPEPPDPQFMPGGVSAGIDTNASGFRRKKSSARTSGLTTKGTSQFKIAGQSAKSSGLNIGL